MDRSLRRELKSTFGNNNYWFNTSKFKNAVEIKIRSGTEVIEFLVPKEMVSTSSVRLFVIWTTLPSIVLIIIALIAAVALSMSIYTYEDNKDKPS